MKIYRNEQHGFEIQIPEVWVFHSLGNDRSLIFKCASNEAFNIRVGPLKSEPALEEVENKLQEEARKKGFVSLHLGRIRIEGKEHVWARYYQGGGLWSKKYIVILDKV